MDNVTEWGHLGGLNTHWTQRGALLMNGVTKKPLKLCEAKRGHKREVLLLCMAQKGPLLLSGALLPYGAQ